MGSAHGSAAETGNSALLGVAAPLPGCLPAWAQSAPVPAKGLDQRGVHLGVVLPSLLELGKEPDSLQGRSRDGSGVALGSAIFR